MKNFEYKVLVLVVFTSTVFYGCKKDFLNKPAQGTLSTTQVSTLVGVQGILTGAYAALDGQAGTSTNSSNVAFGGGSAWEVSPDNWIYGSVAGADAHKGSSGSDQPAINTIANFSLDASNGFLNSKWKADYEGISRCNNVLKVLADVAGVSDADKTSISAQARFLRGHYYFDLKKMFNNVPYIDETVTNFIQPNTTDIWSKIEDDFQYAYTNLPATQSEVGRANKWAAGAYLAKTYLYEKKYSAADPLFTTVITTGTNSAGVSYDLVTNFEDNFTASTKNNKETVFAVQQVANDGTNTIANANNGDMLNFPYNSPFRCCGFYQPTFDLVNSFRTDATTGLPNTTTYNSNPVKNDMGILSSAPFTPETGTLDPRLDWTVGRRGIPYLDWGNHPGQNWIREQSSAGPYSPKKNVYYQNTSGTYSDQSSWAPGTANNVNIIRFADVLLMAAEVKAQLGDLATAQNYVNRVRARAANPSGFVYKYQDDTKPTAGFSTAPAANYKISQYPVGAFTAMGQSGALNAIYFERKLELAMEGQRFFDLVRWGIADVVLNAYFSYEGKLTSDITNGHFTKGKNEYYPIPLAQIDLETVNGVSTLKQNPGY